MSISADKINSYNFMKLFNDIYIGNGKFMPPVTKYEKKNLNTIRYALYRALDKKLNSISVNLVSTDDFMDFMTKEAIKFGFKVEYKTDKNATKQLEDKNKNVYNFYLEWQIKRDYNKK